jgi:hypothetical protein
MADRVRRGVLKGAAATGAFSGRSGCGSVQSDLAPKELDGKPMPEPPAERSAGAIRPGRGRCCRTSSPSSPARHGASAARLGSK